MLVFKTKSGIYARPMGGAQFERLPGTSKGTGPSRVRFSRMAEMLEDGHAEAVIVGSVGKILWPEYE